MAQLIADFFARIRADTTGLQQGLQQSKAGLTGLKGALSEIGLGTAASFLTVGGAIAGVSAAIKGSVDETVKYANEVRELSAASGTSAEDASRLIQVLDDYKISADQVAASTRALTAQGLAPSIETIAKLSDEYLKLGNAQQKNEFLLKNFGRAGLQFAEVMQKGSKAILDQGAAVNKSLILTQESVDAARKYEIAVDNLGDSFEALKVSIGKDLLPVLTGFLDDLNAAQRAQEILGKDFNATVIGTDKWNNALKQAKEEQKASADAMLKHADAAGTDNDALKQLTISQQRAADAAKLISEQYQRILSLTFDIANQNRSYADSVADMDKQQQDLEDSKKRLNYQWWQELAAGKATTQSYGEHNAALADIAKQEQDLADQRAKAAEDQKRATAQRIYDMVQQSVSQDGLTEQEFKGLQDLAVTKGLITRADADQAIQEKKTADDYIGYIERQSGAQDSQIAKFDEVNGRMQTSVGLIDTIASHDGQVATFGLNFVSNGAGVSGSYNPAGYTAPAGATGGLSPDERGSSSVLHSNIRDSGGVGISGQSYLIGTGAQPEVFTPKTAGFFTPAHMLKSRDAGGYGMPGEPYYVGMSAQPELFTSSTNNSSPEQNWKMDKHIHIHMEGINVRSQQDLDYLAQEVSRRVARV